MTYRNVAAAVLLQLPLLQLLPLFQAFKAVTSEVVATQVTSCHHSFTRARWIRCFKHRLSQRIR